MWLGVFFFYRHTVVGITSKFVTPSHFFMSIKHFRFIENPKHLFECYTPPTPEVIVWKQHPVWDFLYAANAGYVECRDGYNALVKGSLIDSRGNTYSYMAKAEENCEGRYIVHGGPKHPKRYPSWDRLILECFRGYQHKGKRMMHLNYNPYDNSIDNLCYYHEHPDPKGWYNGYLTFMENTMKQMHLREQLLPENYDVMDYFTNVLFIPHEFTREYERYRKKMNI